MHAGTKQNLVLCVKTKRDGGRVKGWREVVDETKEEERQNRVSERGRENSGDYLSEPIL